MPEYQYAESNTHPEVPVLGARDELNIQKIPEYIRRMDIYVKNIDKNYKNTWRTISKAIDVPYFGEVKLFTKEFLDQCKNHLNEPQNIPTEIKKNIYKRLKRKFICSGGYDLSENIGSEVGKGKNL